MLKKNRLFAHIDWVLIIALVPIMAAGLITMSSFQGNNIFFEKQLAWLAISMAIFLIASFVDWRFLRRTDFLVSIFILTCLLLLSVKIFGVDVHGSTSWLRFGGVSFQPSDLAKVVLIIILAKYFSRRHIQIANFKHIIISGLYALSLFLIVFFQPDFGSAVVLFLVWFGMVLVSGLSKKHLAIIFLIGGVVLALLWSFVFAEYQKARILTFVDPLRDTKGTGYNALQSVVAIGSGGVWGKGGGYGTQSRLNFLPEYETDFVFAAFSEEWGFIGATILFMLYLFVIWRIIKIALLGATNFEILFGLGVAVYFICHITINIGMNLSLLPVTGITLPFMSYGGSHLLAEFLSLGMLMGMRRYGRSMHKDIGRNEVVGV